jgi:NitT/TauT family transport system permease protein
MTMKKKLFPFIPPIFIFILWEIFGRLRFDIPQFLISLGFDKNHVPDFSFLLPISDIIPKFISLFGSGEIFPYIADTAMVTCIGFLLAGIFGILFGLWVGLSKRAEKLFFPSIDAMRSVPPIALFPVIILFFGIENTMKIIFIFFGAIWPIIINTVHGVKSVDPMYIKVSHNLGHSSKTTLWRVIFPSSLPGIFTGLNISLSISLILAIVCEMLIGNRGLGFFLNYSKRNFDYDEMYATIFIIAIMGWLLNKLFILLDKKILNWYYESKDAQLEYHHKGEA